MAFGPRHAASLISLESDQIVPAPLPANARAPLAGVWMIERVGQSAKRPAICGCGVSEVREGDQGQTANAGGSGRSCDHHSGSDTHQPETLQMPTRDDFEDGRFQMLPPAALRSPSGHQPGRQEAFRHAWLLDRVDGASSALAENHIRIERKTASSDSTLTACRGRFSTCPLPE